MGGEGNLEFSLMSILVFLILASLALAVSALGGFIWAVRTGQFEDTCTPTMRPAWTWADAIAAPARIAMTKSFIDKTRSGIIPANAFIVQNCYHSQQE